jgi:hypothetical protein
MNKVSQEALKERAALRNIRKQSGNVQPYNRIEQE